MREAPVLGVFAGGRATRMGGRDKAELPAPEAGETLLARNLRLGRELGFCTVIVGGPARAEAQVIADAPAGIGPLGGLAGLLAFAGERHALALACDMPFISAALLARLASSPSRAAVLAPRDPETGKWQPLFARYEAKCVRPLLERALAEGTRSFQTFFRTLELEELLLSHDERALLRDWDEPTDID